jgi:hypothetical protein
MTSRTDLTFKHNLNQGRHSWLRLTPAYSVKLVHQILDDHPCANHVLDPFCGTGTTALVCGERGIACDTLDINPFLVWFTRIKTRNFIPDDLQDARKQLDRLYLDVPSERLAQAWTPPIKDIERWWSPNALNILAQLYAYINQLESPITRDLYQIAFCRILIEVSNAAFNHQSMSFKAPPPSLFDLYHHNLILESFGKHLRSVLQTCQQTLRGQITVTQADARNIPPPKQALYDCLITSPPYPNRMSYIRELRPYMYWLGFLTDSREAGELDWQAIGGTWGIATSRVTKWQPLQSSLTSMDTFVDDQFLGMIEQIKQSSPTLANYVYKYFVDIADHIVSLLPHLQSNAKVSYVIGNSKFYDVVVPSEAIYARIFQGMGFRNVTVTPIRKRNSKKELFEYIVSGFMK